MPLRTLEQRLAHIGFCPWCYTGPLTELSLERGKLEDSNMEDNVYRNIRCDNCGHEWQDKFMLKSYFVLKQGDSAEEAP